MFEKKQLIYSETQGLCRVENIVQLSGRKNKERSIGYYVLRPLFDKEQTSYIPVEHHRVELRELFSEDEARDILSDEETEKNDKLRRAAKYILGISEPEEGGTDIDGTTAEYT